MTTWTEPVTWVNNDIFDSLDMNEFVRDNLLYLRNAAASAALRSIRHGTVIPADRDPEWKTIESFFMTTFGKDIYASIEFKVVNGTDTWGPGTIFVGTSDTTDIVERVGERIERVAIRDGYTRSPRWQNLLRQRQTVAKLIKDIEEARTTYDNVGRVFGPGRPPLWYLQPDEHGRPRNVSNRDASWLRWIASRYADVGNWWQRWGRADYARQEQTKSDINNQMRAEGVVWRHRNIRIPGEDRKVTESSQIVNTRVITQQETITYDTVFVRLYVDDMLSRELIHDGAGETESGAFYIPNIPAGNHLIRLQWRSPQFTGHEPLSGTLIHLTNLNLQLKEVRYPLLDIVTDGTGG